MADVHSIAYLNGAYLPVGSARISPLDRGFLFADSVYEVVPVFDGRPLLFEAHTRRLNRSLEELAIENPHSDEEWRQILDELIRQNGGGNQAVYLQVTRGADSGRDHACRTGLTQTVFGMSSPVSSIGHDGAGLQAITLPDERWARCDIKSTALLANVMARQRAAALGADEALFIRDGFVTEAASCSVLIVEGDTVYRRPDGQDILPGTTTRLVEELVRQTGRECREEPISEARLRGADEIWLTAATRGVAPVVRLDGNPVGDGAPGPAWRQVAALFDDFKVQDG